MRAELAWVVTHKIVELGFLFAMLKVLTSGLGKQEYGEYNLAETAVMLIGTVLLMPVHEAYMRDYHGGVARGDRRSATVVLMRWYAIATWGTAGALALSSGYWAERFGIGTWTPLAAGFVFLGECWRALGHGWLNIERRRRAGTLWNIGFLTIQLSLVAAAVTFGSSRASTALLAYACASLLFGALVTGPIVLELLRLPPGGRSRLPGLILSFGVPLATLQLLLWVQTFSDRYLVKGLLDPENVGLYVAAYQVSGVPFVLAQRIGHELLTPIAYERSRDADDPAQLWSADRLILGGTGAQLLIGMGMLAFYLFFGSRLLVFLTSDAFLLPGTTIAVLAAGRFVQSVSQTLQAIFAVHRQMRRLLWFRIMGAILTPTLCSFTIPRWGISGAAAGMLLSFLAYLLVFLLAPGGCLSLIRQARRTAMT